MTSRVLSTIFLVSLVSSVAAVDPTGHKDVKSSILNPALKDKTPDITSDRIMLTRRFLLSPLLRQKRQARSSTTTLKWVPMRSGNSLPSGAVRIYNSYAKRYDYVCRCNCQAGFYGRGSVCRYPSASKELACSQFEVLVNKDDFEILEWKDGYYGSVPQNPVETCSDQDIYVGKNKYGLGKVQVSQKCFYLPWKGSRYWYWSYQVLTFNDKISREHISDVKYNINSAKRTSYSPEIMIRSNIVNNQCKPIKKSFMLSNTYQEQKRWDTSIAITDGVLASITASIPFLSPAGIRLSAVTTKQLSSGSTIMTPKTLSINVKVRVPPKHSCVVSLLGHRYKIRVPFTARLSRTYRNGITRQTSISGMYSSVKIVEVRSVVNRCYPLSKTKCS